MIWWPFVQPVRRADWTWTRGERPHPRGRRARGLSRVSYSPDADRLRWGDRSSEQTEAAGSTESDELANATRVLRAKIPHAHSVPFAAPG